MIHIQISLRSASAKDEAILDDIGFCSFCTYHRLSVHKKFTHEGSTIYEIQHQNNVIGESNSPHQISSLWGINSDLPTIKPKAQMENLEEALVTAASLVHIWLLNELFEIRIIQR